MIERAAIGGTCVHYVRTPTKTMVASAEIAYLARRAREFGVQAGEVKVEMHAARECKRGMVKTWREGSEKRRQTGHVEVIRGEGRFLGPRQLQVRLDQGSRLGEPAREPGPRRRRCCRS